MTRTASRVMAMFASPLADPYSLIRSTHRTTYPRQRFENNCLHPLLLEPVTSPKPS